MGVGYGLYLAFRAHFEKPFIDKCQPHRSVGFYRQILGQAVLLPVESNGVVEFPCPNGVLFYAPHTAT